MANRLLGKGRLAKMLLPVAINSTYCLLLQNIPAIGVFMFFTDGKIFFYFTTATQAFPFFRRRTTAILTKVIFLSLFRNTIPNTKTFCEELQLSKTLAIFLSIKHIKNIAIHLWRVIYAPRRSCLVHRKFLPKFIIH